MKKVRTVINRPSKGKMVRNAGLESWQNVNTKLRPSDVCKAFILSHIDHPLAAEMTEIVELFSHDSAAAKRRAEGVAILEYEDAQVFRIWHQFKALIFKSGDGSSNDAARKAAATSAFLAGEAKCRRVNKKLRWYLERPNRMPENIRVLWSRARETIRSTLGPFDSKRLWGLVSLAQPGSGVAIGTKDRDAVSPVFKYGHTDLVVTREALPYARMMVESSPIRTDIAGVRDNDGNRILTYKIVEGNRVSWVKKDTLTDRTIAVEPSCNVELQLGVHLDWARRVLPRLGVTIDDQGQNRVAAQRGARDWRSLDPLVTLDMRNSSGSISAMFVRAFIPDNGWLGYLDALRSKKYTLEGSQHDYEMWSSMGNGYTFALQCLIFKALADAALSLTDSEGQSCVFGDDIVVPRGCAALLIEALKFFGLEINTSKSFLFGPFRESCGSDSFEECDVTPVYIRGIRTLRLTDLYRLYNRFRFSAVPSRDIPVSEYLMSVLDVFGPHPEIPHFDPMDETGVKVEGPPARRTAYYHRFEQRWYTLRVAFSPVQVRHDQSWAYCSALRGAEECTFDPKGEFSLNPRRRKGRYVLVASPW